MPSCYPANHVEALNIHRHQETSNSFPVSEMTYTVSSGTLNSTIPYHLTRLMALSEPASEMYNLYSALGITVIACRSNHFLHLLRYTASLGFICRLSKSSSTTSCHVFLDPYHHSLFLWTLWLCLLFLTAALIHHTSVMNSDRNGPERRSG